MICPICFSNLIFIPFLHLSSHTGFPSTVPAYSCFGIFALALPFTWDALSPEPMWITPSLCLGFSHRSPSQWGHPGPMHLKPHSPHGLLSDPMLCCFFSIVLPLPPLCHTIISLFISCLYLPQECKAQKGREFGCLLHHSIPRAWKNGWHIVGVQEIFVE